MQVLSVDGDKVTSLDLSATMFQNQPSQTMIPPIAFFLLRLPGPAKETLGAKAVEIEKMIAEWNKTNNMGLIRAAGTMGGRAAAAVTRTDTGVTLRFESVCFKERLKGKIFLP